MVYSRDSSGVRRWRRFVRFFASMPFLCLLVDSAVAGPCRDLVDLNARARGAWIRNRADSDAAPPRGPYLRGA